MHIFSILAPLTSMAALVSSGYIFRPEPSVPQGLTHGISKTNAVEKRARPAPGFYFCSNADFKGVCYTDESAFGTCVNVQNDLLSVHDTFGDSISSAYPDRNNVCIIYRDNECTGPNVTIHHPGVSDLSDLGFNDVMSSFRCNAITKA